MTTTRTGYGQTLTRLVEAAGEQHSLASLTPEIYGVVMDRWHAAAPATWNRHLSALSSFTAWA